MKKFILVLIALLAVQPVDAGKKSEKKVVSATSTGGAVIASSSSSLSTDFNFLSSKYEALVTKAKAPFRPLDIEDHVTYHESEGSKIGMSGEDYAFEQAKARFEAKVNDPGFIEDILETSPATQIVLELKQLAALEDGHPKHGFYEAYFKRKMKLNGKNSPNLLEDILLSAEYLYQLISDQADEKPVALFVGRSPCMIQVAYEAILAKMENNQQRAEHVNFSGHPDIDTIRSDSFFQENQDAYRARNLLTPEKLAHYFKYLGSKNLEGASTIYLVDIMSSGASLNSFYRILNAYFDSIGKVAPKVKFVSISANSMLDKIGSTIFNYIPQGKYSENKWKLVYNDSELLSKNVHPLEIEAHTIPVSQLTQTMLLDFDELQASAIHGIQYPAQKWTPAHDAERERGGIWKSKVYDFLRRNVNVLLDWHMKKFKIEAISEF